MTGARARADRLIRPALSVRLIPNIPLALAIGDYLHTRELANGRVRPWVGPPTDSSNSWLTAVSFLSAHPSARAILFPWSPA